LASSPGGGLVEAQQLRTCGDGAGNRHELALTLGEIGGRQVGQLAQRQAGSSASSIASVWRDGRVNSSLIDAPIDGWRAATIRFSRTDRSSNSSTACHVRANPRRARTWG
jgi:hypothetical protein